jgi:hypothetical protein
LGALRAIRSATPCQRHAESASRQAGHVAQRLGHRSVRAAALAVTPLRLLATRRASCRVVSARSALPHGSIRGGSLGTLRTLRHMPPKALADRNEKGRPQTASRPPTSDNASCRTSDQEMHEDGNADQARGSHAQRHQFKMQSATGRRHVGSALPFNGATYVPGRVAACYSVSICCFALTKLASFDGLPDRPRGLLLGGGRATQRRVARCNGLVRTAIRQAETAVRIITLPVQLVH